MDYIPMRTIEPQSIARMKIILHMSQRLKTGFLQSDCLPARACADFNAR
jgi:hypothetical protein